MLQFSNGTKTNEIYSLLMENRLYSAALFYLGINDTPMQRAGRVTRRYFEREMPPPELYYDLPDCRVEYGSGFIGDRGVECGLYVDVCGDVVFDREKFLPIAAQYKDEPRMSLLMDDLMWDARVRLYDQTKVFPPRYFHGGGHSVCDIEKILKIGFWGIAKEIRAARGQSTDPVYLSFCDGLLDTIEGVGAYIKRCAAHFADMAVRTGNPEIKKIADAYARNIVMQPVHSFYDAFLTVIFLMRNAFSEPGRFDQFMYPYYLVDTESGAITREEAASLFDRMFHRMDDISRGGALHIVIGGCDRQRRPSYNELTKLMLLASRSYAQPNVSLRVNDGMPAEIWDIVLESLGTGRANPALLNEDQFLEELVGTYRVEFEDAVEFGMGGCSETLICGMCNVDGTWTAYNLLDVLHETLGTHLIECETYEELYRIFLMDMEKTVREMLDQINVRQHNDVYRSDPLRTFTHGDCVARGKSFWGGGAKYNFDNTNIYGATNAINGLVVLRQLYEGKLSIDRKGFLEAMDRNFEGHEELLKKCRDAEKFGNNDAHVNELAKEIMTKLFLLIRGVPCYRNGQFMPSVIDYLEFDRIGKKIPATADGRLAGTPMVDSIGPVPGTDQNGPTSMINSVTELPIYMLAGSCVLNVRFDPMCFETRDNRAKMKAFIQTYFKRGGNQMQVNVVDTELLLQARRNPDEHRDIIVRVGGFTDYFVCLSDSVQQSIIERTANKF